MAKLTADVRLGEQEYKGINTVSLPKTGVSTGERATFTLDEGLTGIVNAIDPDGNLITTVTYNAESIPAESINVWPSNNSATSVYLGNKKFRELSDITVGKATNAVNATKATDAVNATNVGLTAAGGGSPNITVTAGTGKAAATFTVNNVANATDAINATNVGLTVIKNEKGAISIQAGNGTAAEFTVNNVANAENATSANKVLMTTDSSSVVEGDEGIKVTLQDGMFYIAKGADSNGITSIEFTMPNDGHGHYYDLYNCYAKVVFKSRIDPTLSFLPAGQLKYIGTVDSVEAGKTYEISFMNGVIAIAEVSSETVSTL